jgi:hypothetical protein
MQSYTVYFTWKLLCKFRVVPPLIIRSTCKCIYIIWYLSCRYCYLPLSWKSWNRFECAVSGVRHPQHTQTSSNSSTIAADIAVTAWQIPDAVDTVACTPDDEWKYHPKHVEQFPDKINCVTSNAVKPVCFNTSINNYKIQSNTTCNINYVLNFMLDSQESSSGCV